MSIEHYHVTGLAEFVKEMKENGSDGPPRVSLHFEMTTSGLVRLSHAEAGFCRGGNVRCH